MAIPPAAAVPVRNAVGNRQKGPITLHRPDTHNVIAATTTSGGSGNDNSNRPMPAPHTASATCQRHSFVRSECRPCRIITGIVTRYGTAANNPSCDLLNCGNVVCSRVGRKKSIPYPPTTLRK